MTVCVCGHDAAEHTTPRRGKPRGICWATDCGCARYTALSAPEQAAPMRPRTYDATRAECRRGQHARRHA